jgi:predicted transcriptional regulator
MAVHNPFHHTDADTLAMLMPAAEIEIMRVLWTQGALNGKAILVRVNEQRQIAEQRKIAYTTVMTTVERLVEKGLLTRSEARSGQGGSYSYIAVMSECDFVMRAVHQMLDCVVRDYPSAITQYLDTRREVAAG